MEQYYINTGNWKILTVSKENINKYAINVALYNLQHSIVGNSRTRRNLRRGKANAKRLARPTALLGQTSKSADF